MAHRAEEQEADGPPASPRARRSASSFRRRVAAIGVGLAAAVGAYAAIAASLSGAPTGIQLAWATLASAITGLLAFLSLRNALDGRTHQQATTSAPAAVEVGLAARQQLPVDIDHFTDRTDQLRELERVLTSNETPAATRPPIALIRGGGGVGKSALALHLAHLAAPRFPDAQLYLRLGGERLPAVPPGAALETLLRGLGVHHGAIPADLEERKAVYRSQLAGQRALLLLDNVLDEDQVEPLLPASPGCAVLVTSRQQLTGLAGTHVVELDELPAPDAVRLLEQLIGRERVAGDRRAAERIVRACGNLPMAVQMAAASLNTTARRRAPLAVYAAQLEDERHRLDLLEVGNRGVRAGFALDYEGLSGGAARLFRLLGLLRVPDLGLQALATLGGLDVGEAERLRDELVNAYLLDVTGPGADRYGLHDLLRVFAREHAEAEEAASERQAAVERVFAWYLAKADEATAYIDPTRAAHTARLLARTDGRQTTDEPLAEAARADRLRVALDWFERERVTLVALVLQADGMQAHELVWRLTASMTHFFDVRNHWTDWITTHDLGLRAARAAGEPRAEAEILIGLGLVHRSQGHAERAATCLEQAAGIAYRIGDRQLEGWARNDLGHVQAKYLRRFDDAIESLTAALRLFAEVGDTRGEASAHDNLGLVHKGQHRLAEAAAATERSLALFGQLHEPWGQSWVLHNLGELYREQGRFAEATGCFERALAIFTDVTGDRLGEGWALQALGHTYREQGRLDQALATSQRALALLRQLNADDSVASALDSLGQTYARQQRFDEAIACHREALALFRELGNEYCAALTLTQLGQVYREQRLLHEAIEQHQRALRIFRQVGDRHCELEVLRNLATDYEQSGDPAQAEQYLAQAAALADQLDASQAAASGDRAADAGSPGQ